MSATAANAAPEQASNGGRPKVLVKEKIGDSGVSLLREHFDVDLGVDWSDEELLERIGAYDGIVIRSATKMTAELIDRAGSLRVIGRAGVGVDNVDVEAATKRGIVVANAPQSNVVTAAEHTMALLLALARNIPQAHMSLTSGKWERSKFSGVELYEKTLGIVGFGRIGQLVAHRARGFGMRVLAFDPFVSAERYRELGVEKAADSDDLYAQADFITVHLPKTPETEGWLNAEAFAKMRDGVRILNVARGGPDRRRGAEGRAGLRQGRRRRARRVPVEPMTDYPLFKGYPNVVVTPHLGASTAEATDRAGYQSAEQVVAALTGGVVSTAVNIPSIERRGHGGARAVPAAGHPAGTAGDGAGRGQLGGADRGRLHGADRGLRHASADARRDRAARCRGARRSRSTSSTRPAWPSERGIVVEEKSVSEAQDFNELIRVTVVAGGERVAVAGTGIGPNRVPHLVEVQGRRLTIELERFVTVFRYADLPGMIGRVGTIFGAHGINISSAAVGHTADGLESGAPADGEGGGGSRGSAAMVVTTDVLVPAEVVREIVASEGFLDGWAVVLR